MSDVRAPLVSAHRRRATARTRGAAAPAAKKPGPIDPLTGPQLALAGRVVTMDDAFTVKTDAIVYLDQRPIVAVQDRAQPAPAGFDDVLR